MYSRKPFTFIFIILILSVKIASSNINPNIQNVNPPLNANSASKYTNIVIVFTQDMNAATLNSNNIKVFGNQTGLLECAYSYNGSTKCLTIDPDQDLKYGEVISVTLKKEIKTSGGENIGPLVYSFTVQAITGTGTFIKSSALPGSGVTQCGDIDKDGKVDLVIGNKIYKNIGSAQFTFLVELSLPGSPKIGDFDNDRDLDILLQNDNEVYFFKNDGMGNFVHSGTFNGGVNSTGDLNGDGYLDISYLQTEKIVSTIHNYNGSFTNDTAIALSLDCSVMIDYLDKSIINDMDNDGDNDIVAISGYYGGSSITFYDLCKNVNLLINNGNGRFLVDNVYSNTTTGAPLWVLSSGDTKINDFNQDGFNDIATPGSMLLSNQNGSFINSGSITSFCNAVNADLNGDGYIDLSFNIPGASLFTLINNGTGVFEGIAGSGGNFSFNSAFGDFDGDGDIDVALSEYFSGNTAILRNGDNPLPVELQSFTYNVNENDVNLSWQTLSENNNKGFELERSAFNSVWINIGFISGLGNSSGIKNYYFSDLNLLSGKYNYRLKQIDFNGNFEYHELSAEVIIGIPTKFNLSQNYPNPFNPTTKIAYELPEDAFVKLTVYDNSGREVARLVNESKIAGYHIVNFNGADFTSGIYFYKIEAGKFNDTRKMVLVK